MTDKDLILSVFIINILLKLEQSAKYDAANFN